MSRRSPSGAVALEVHPVPKAADQHYTILTISKFNRTLNGWAIKNIKEYLSALYKPDLEQGTVDLRFDHESLGPLPEFDQDSFLKRVDGTPYRRKSTRRSTATRWAAGSGCWRLE